jgi:hypothetical protein
LLFLFRSARDLDASEALCAAPLTALFGWPASGSAPNGPWTSTWHPQRDIAHAEDERAVRGRSVRGLAAPAIRPVLIERRLRDSDATAPTASPPEAQWTRLEVSEDAEPEPQLREHLEAAGAADPQTQAAPCSVRD